MENKIPQKSFDAQMHIIRDVHFDVDKYKAGELYVINNTLKILDNNNELNDIDKTLKDFVDCEPILFQKNKVIGELIKVDERSLTFKVLVNHPDPRYVAVYSYVHFTLSIDKILEYHIEIERLLTETEAAMYLSVGVLDDAKKKVFEEVINSKDCEHKNLDPKDPKFNRMLGLVPDMNQFPYTLENTNSYQELDAAYKNEPDIDSESQEDSNIDRNEYFCSFSFRERPVSFINDNGAFAYELFDNYKDGSFKVTLTKDNSILSMRISVKNFKADADTITFRNGNNTISITLHKDSFYKIFDNIKFEL